MNTYVCEHASCLPICDTYVRLTQSFAVLMVLQQEGEGESAESQQSRRRGSRSGAIIATTVTRHLQV